MKYKARKQNPFASSEILRAAQHKSRPDAKRCDANRHRACEKRKPARPNTRDRSHLPGLSGRETRLLKRLADGWQLNIVLGGKNVIAWLVRGANRVKAFPKEVANLVERKLITLRHGLTVAGKAVLDHCAGLDPDVPIIAPTKRVLTMGQQIRREAGVTLMGAVARKEATA